MEKREAIALDGRTQQRLYVLNHILAGELTADEAGRVLQLSVRQVRRLLERYRGEGAAALVHGNHDRAPAHRTGDELRVRLVELATTTYAGVNRAHPAELLAERERIDIAPPGRSGGSCRGLRSADLHPPAATPPQPARAHPWRRYRDRGR